MKSLWRTKELFPLDGFGPHIDDGRDEPVV